MAEIEGNLRGDFGPLEAGSAGRLPKLLARSAWRQSPTSSQANGIRFVLRGKDSAQIVRRGSGAVGVQ
jgi:hypothetical protein